MKGTHLTFFVIYLQYVFLVVIYEQYNVNTLTFIYILLENLFISLFIYKCSDSFNSILNKRKKLRCI